MKIGTKAMKVYPDDEYIMNTIAAERFYKKIDKKQLSPARILKAALRIPNVKETLLKARISKDVK